ncbi:MAG: hypothetical protein WAM73_00715 [Desulfobacterales bacterium]
MKPENLSFFSQAMEKMDQQRADAESRVKRLPCSQGGTVNEYLDQQGSNPSVEDHGWSTTPVDEGFEVERLMILLGTKELTYRWRVTPDGKIRAVNGKALSITKSTEFDDT